eukprot:6560380-Alexandrium_andersonii.AAC.1
MGPLSVGSTRPCQHEPLETVNESGPIPAGAPTISRAPPTYWSCPDLAAPPSRGRAGRRLLPCP